MDEQMEQGGRIDEKDKIVTIQELETIEQLIKNELTEYLNNKENFLDSNYVQYYYLMKHIDSNICKELTNKVIKDEVDVLNFVKNFCVYGQQLTGEREKLYHFDKRINEEFDTKKVYDILVEGVTCSFDFDSDLDLIKASYIMSFEKGFVDEDYSIKDIKEYFNNKKFKD